MWCRQLQAWNQAWQWVALQMITWVRSAWCRRVPRAAHRSAGPRIAPARSPSLLRGRSASQPAAHGIKKTWQTCQSSQTCQAGKSIAPMPSRPHASCLTSGRWKRRTQAHQGISAVSNSTGSSFAAAGRVVLSSCSRVTRPLALCIGRFKHSRTAACYSDGGRLPAVLARVGAGGGHSLQGMGESSSSLRRAISASITSSQLVSPVLESLRNDRGERRACWGNMAGVHIAGRAHTDSRVDRNRREAYAKRDRSQRPPFQR